MRKLFLIAVVAICITACNNSADNGKSGDSTATMSSDTVSSGSAGSSNMQSPGGSPNATMQGTGSADTGFHGSTADSSKMSAKDTSGAKSNSNK